MTEQEAPERQASPAKTAEEDQKALFDRIADKYQAHYADKHSLLYRDKFINRALFEGIPLAGKAVLDAACGDGETTEYLLAQGAAVTGLDISSKMIESFNAKFPNCTGLCASIFSTGFANDTFDCVSIVGGLHHFHPDVQKAIDEVCRILKPGGFFCFFEPPSGTLPDVVRKRWYKWGSDFAENEASIDIQALQRANSDRFRFISQTYGGNTAYLAVLQSFHFSVPRGLKGAYSPLAMFLESLIAPVQPRFLSCFVICQWQKTPQ